MFPVFTYERLRRVIGRLGLGEHSGFFVSEPPDTAAYEHDDRSDPDENLGDPRSCVEVGIDGVCACDRGEGDKSADEHREPKRSASLVQSGFPAHDANRTVTMSAVRNDATRVDHESITSRSDPTAKNVVSGPSC